MASIQKEKVLEKLRQRQTDATEAATADAVDRAEAYFLSETRRRVVPPLAFWVWVDLAGAMLRLDAADIEQRVSSIKRGDTTVQYQDGADDPLAAFDRQLTAFRVGVIR